MEKTQNASHQDEIFPIRNADYISKTATKQTLDQSAVNENNTSSSPLISRRDSIRKGPKNRIDVLLQEDQQQLFQKEIEHERVVNSATQQLLEEAGILGPIETTTPASTDNNTQQQQEILASPSTCLSPFGSTEGGDSASLSHPLPPRPPSSTASNNTTTTSTMAIDKEMILTGEALKQLPSRAISIPNEHLYNPATYFSHSSKLNPENSFLSQRQQKEEMLLSNLPQQQTQGNNSNNLTIPTMTSTPKPHSMKRKGSFSEERFEPYKKHKMPSSPIMRPVSPMVSSPNLNPTQLPYNSSLAGMRVFPAGLFGYASDTRKRRSNSVSSLSSSASMMGVEKPLGSSAVGPPRPPPTIGGTGTEGQAFLVEPHTLPPPKSPMPPRLPAQSLNLSLTQEELNKLSINFDKTE